jgi:hypothetical protein
MLNRNLSDVLKRELKFLEGGGYRATQAWRPSFIFEDSPTCLHRGRAAGEAACQECVLRQFVPPQAQSRENCCRLIPLNQQGETLDDLYTYATEAEIEHAVQQWLKATIARLEDEQPARPTKIA